MSKAGTPTYPASTIAKLLLLTDRRVQQLAKDGIIPKAERGRYELAPCVQGYIRFLQDRNVTAGAGSPIDYAAEKAKKLKAERQRVELELSRAQGEVVPLAQLERALANVFAEVKTNIRSVPSRVATAILGEESETRIKAVILKEIDQALESLGDFDLEPDDDDE